VSKYAAHTSRRVTPQSESARDDQVANSAGGFSFALDKWKRLERFLILGAEGGTYYIGERKLTKENVGVLDACAREDGRRLVDQIVAVSEAGRAPKQAPCIFALAYLAGHNDKEVRKLALAGMPRVCRTGTHLFEFLADIEQFRGWGRLLREAVSNWYTSKDARALAYQLVKYKQRGGETHADALRRAHPKATDPDLREVLAYAARKLVNADDDETVDEKRAALYTQINAGSNYNQWLQDEKGHRRLIAAAEQARKATSEQEILRLIRDHDLVRECIPTEYLNSKKVWEALLVKMPLGAMVRNLAKMTNIELIAPMSDAVKTVCERLGNQELIKHARLHPMAILLALKTYAAGRGFRGKLEWKPVPQVVDALDSAFYLAFDSVEPTGKRWLLGLDVSGSMSSSIAGTNLSCCEAAGAMAMVTMRTESLWYCHGFCETFVDLTKNATVHTYYGSQKRVAGFSAKSRLDAVVATMSNRNFGRTDCALPMMHALEHKIPVDVFAVYTDNETWAGRIHPFQALRMYREKMGIPAKLIVLGMTSNRFTIADPKDAGMLDVVGFDASVPPVMADFARQ